MEEKILLYQIEQRGDGTLGIGNSIEVESVAEAIDMIKTFVAKHPDYPIGVVPESFEE